MSKSKLGVEEILEAELKIFNAPCALRDSLLKALRLYRAERKQNQPFIEAAAAYEELLSRDMRNAANKEAIQVRLAVLHSTMLATGRARREGMK